MTVAGGARLAALKWAISVHVILALVGWTHAQTPPTSAPTPNCAVSLPGHWTSDDDLYADDDFEFLDAYPETGPSTGPKNPELVNFFQYQGCCG